jgi:hypothetical protein
LYALQFGQAGAADFENSASVQAVVYSDSAGNPDPSIIATGLSGYQYSNVIPEPASLVLVAMAAVGILAGMRRHGDKKQGTQVFLLPTTRFLN